MDNEWAEGLSDDPRERVKQIPIAILHIAIDMNEAEEVITDLKYQIEETKNAIKEIRLDIKGWRSDIKELEAEYLSLSDGVEPE